MYVLKYCMWFFLNLRLIAPSNGSLMSFRQVILRFCWAVFHLSLAPTIEIGSIAYISPTHPKYSFVSYLINFANNMFQTVLSY